VAYVCSRPPSRPIRLPRRPWNSGMGQLSLSASVCAALGITSGWCSQFNLPTPPGANAPPGAPQTTAQMTVPGGYTPADSAADQGAAIVQNANTFFQNFEDPGAVPACDWTAAVWTDPTTYCAGNWLIVGGVVLVIGLAIWGASKGKF
jgi:hypothetical protein